MFGSTLLEVIVGIVFIYVLLSLLATTLNELILSLILSARGKDLEKAIVTMLSDRKPAKESPIEGNNPPADSGPAHPSRSSGRLGTFLPAVPQLDPNDLAERFYQHPYIVKLAKQGKNNRPSYIANATFSSVLLDLLRVNRQLPVVLKDIEATLQTIPDKNTRAILTLLIQEANGDIAHFRKSVESWYDDMMDRASGWYKRRVQKALLLIGFCISAFLNADTFNMAHTLMNNPAAREKLVKQALAYRDAQQKQKDSMGVARPLPLDSAAFRSVAQALDSVNKQLAYLRQEEVINATSIAGMGWDSPATPLDRTSLSAFFKSLVRHWRYILFRIPGWCITALAITLGAPFWFDMLNKVINIRTAGIKPEEKKSSPASPPTHPPTG